MRGGAAGVPEAWYDNRHNLAAVARYMYEQGDTSADVAYMLEKPWKFEEDWRLSKPEGVGTGAGEGATGQDTGNAWVTRSEDCPEAPAQAHPLGPDPSGTVADEAYAAGCRAGRVDALREAADDVPLFEFMLVMDIASEVAPAQIAAWLRARAEEVGR